MGRLTKYGKTSHENGVCCTHFMGAECREVNGECSYGCKWEEEAWSKLAHYEDLEEQGRLVEQKHGTWESLDSYVYECDGMWQCSECKEDFYFEFGTPLDCRAYYCPNCGAKMELKELEE